MAGMNILGFVCLLSLTFAQIPIPSQEVGYVYKNGRANASIHLDAYIDLICPYSKQALPTLMQVAEAYGPQTLKLTAHLFPLPYHRNSFYATKGTHAMASLTEGNATFDWITLIYKNIDSLINSATDQFSENQMKTKLSVYASELGVMPELFIPLLDNPNIEEDTRVAWKYACSRGVAGTPTFMVNDVLVAGSPTWTVSDWKKLIDSVLHPSHTLHYLKSSACPSGTKLCEYLPGKTECCTAGEDCIPNVGCRC